jgi:hypothetical protein
MQVHALILQCTAFVGSPSSKGFSAIGTGFLVQVHEDNFDFHYLISCRHLVWPSFSHRDSVIPSEPIYLRFNSKHGGAPRVIETKRTDWTFPEDRHVDICAYPIDFQRHDPDDNLEINYLALRPRSFANGDNQAQILPGLILERDLTLGEEIFIVGTFIGRVGERRNIPIVRVGNVAALPVEPIDYASPRDPAYLIETRSLGGISGSPVFNNPSLLRHAETAGGFQGPFAITDTRTGKTTQHMITNYKLAGMVIGAHSGQYADDFVSETDTDIETGEPAKRGGPHVDTDFNAGISVMLPVMLLEKFLLSAEMKQTRARTLETRKKQSGYFPTSAPPT